MSKHYFWDEPYLYKYCPNQIIRRRILEIEHDGVLKFAHQLMCGGHFGPKRTTTKILQSDFLAFYFQRCLQLVSIF